MEICAPCCSAKCRLQRSCFIFPVVKKFCRTCLVWRFRQTFPTRRSLSTSRCLVCRHPWVLLCAASSTRTVGIWSISTLPELSAAVFVFLIQQDLPSAGTVYPVLHAAPHSPPPDQRPLSAPDAPLTTGHTFCSRRPHSQKGFLASPEGPPLPDRMGNSRIHCLTAPYVLTLPQLVIESIPCPVIVSRVILPNRE